MCRQEYKGPSPASAASSSGTLNQSHLCQQRPQITFCSCQIVKNEVTWFQVSVKMQSKDERVNGHSHFGKQVGTNLQNRTLAHPTTQSSTPGRYYSPSRALRDTRPLSGHGIDKLWCIQTVDYYTSVKVKELQ